MRPTLDDQLGRFGCTHGTPIARGAFVLCTRPSSDALPPTQYKAVNVSNKHRHRRAALPSVFSLRRRICRAKAVRLPTEDVATRQADEARPLLPQSFDCTMRIRSGFKTVIVHFLASVACVRACALTSHVSSHRELTLTVHVPYCTEFASWTCCLRGATCPTRPAPQRGHTCCNRDAGTPCLATAPTWAV